MRFSIIVPFDNDFELIDNFCENLLRTTDFSDGEIIFVSDGCRDIQTLTYLREKARSNTFLRLIESEQRKGYSVSNNIGVRECNGDYLVFINSDVLPESGSILKLISVLDADETIGMVQGLLIYPQNGKVQSTGHLFTAYQNFHVYAGENINSPFVKKSGTRQALTTAFCAVRRTDFLSVGMFDELYYNAFEGMEMSLKISQLGKRCFYYAEAVAYHIVGGSRNNIQFNNEVASHIFWSRWHNKLVEDLHTYIQPQLPTSIMAYSFFWIQASSMIGWDNVLKKLSINVSGNLILQDRFAQKINLYNNLPFASLEYPAPYVFTVNQLSALYENKKWISDRNNPHDIVIDNHGLYRRLKDL